MGAMTSPGWDANRGSTPTYAERGRSVLELYGQQRLKTTSNGKLWFRYTSGRDCSPARDAPLHRRLIDNVAKPGP